MRQFVASEVVATREGCRADGTLVRLRRVDQHVLLQVRLSPKPLATRLTLERLYKNRDKRDLRSRSPWRSVMTSRADVTVREQVSAQEAFRVEHLVAAFARELVVARLEMVLQCCLRCVATATLLTLELPEMEEI